MMNPTLPVIDVAYAMDAKCVESAENATAVFVRYAVDIIAMIACGVCRYAPGVKKWRKGIEKTKTIKIIPVTCSAAWKKGH